MSIRRRASVLQQKVVIAAAILLAVAVLINQCSVAPERTHSIVGVDRVNAGSAETLPRGVVGLPIDQQILHQDPHNGLQHARQDVDEIYYGLALDEKLDELQKQITIFTSQIITCETNFIRVDVWCDSNPGNGMKNFFKSIALGFILDRIPLISVHRRHQCEGHFLDFKRAELFISTGVSDEKFLASRQCQRKPETVSIGGSGNFSYACSSVGARQETFMRIVDPLYTEISQMSDLQFNPSLSREQLVRVRRVVDVGYYTAVGMLTDQILDISAKVKAQFFGDYHPGPAAISMLSDSAVLKVGIHVRHLPFVVQDEGGPQNIDKRALKCLEKAITNALKEGQSRFTKGCLVVVANDMTPSRDNFAKRVAGLGSRCKTLVIKRTANTSDEWGAPSYSEWEKRDPKGDRRGMLEAYLDYYALSEYSDFVVFSSASTFSQMIGYRNSKKREVDRNVEFACSSCKEEYHAYACCHIRKRWKEMSLITRNAAIRCTH